jgi:hypothetical protein
MEGMGMTYGEWLDKLKEIISNTDNSYHELVEYYNFKAAYEDQMTPEKAYADCCKLLGF